MFVNWDMMQLAFKDPAQTPYAGKIKAATMPGAKPGLSGSIEGHEYMAVPSPSLHKDAAKKFMKYVTSASNQKIRAIESGQTPVLKELFNDPDVKRSFLSMSSSNLRRTAITGLRYLKKVYTVLRYHFN